jgi:hypothetical protein
MTLDDFQTAIAKGEFDSELSVLWDLIKDRKRYLNEQKTVALRYSLKKGDKVKLVGLTPKHLNGRIVEVIEVRKTRITCDIPSRGLATVPISCLVKV